MQSIELYYQEAGRAGRDGLQATCVILYDPKDVFRIAGMAYDDLEKIEDGQTRPKVFSMIKYCHNTTTCRRNILAGNLSQTVITTSRTTCQGQCDICNDSPKQKTNTYPELMQSMIQAVKLSMGFKEEKMLLTAKQLIDQVKTIIKQTNLTQYGTLSCYHNTTIPNLLSY